VPASAEWFTDFYLGGARTPQAQVSFTTNTHHVVLGVSVRF